MWKRNPPHAVLRETQLFELLIRKVFDVWPDLQVTKEKNESKNRHLHQLIIPKDDTQDFAEVWGPSTWMLSA